MAKTETEPERISAFAAYGLPVMLAVLVKLLVWHPGVTPFNADEAIVALMARHINQGQLPFFFYGQSYMGSLDAILTALLFKICGEGVGVIRLLQSGLYLGTVLTTAMLAKRLLKSNLAALAAELIAAVPPVNVTLYTTVSLGGYGEMLLIGNLLLLGGLGIIERASAEGFYPDREHYFGLAAWGLGAGFSFWVIGLSLVYILPVLLVLFWRMRKLKAAWMVRSALVLLGGGVLGAAPWWSPALLEGNTGVISELAGGAIAGANQGWLLLRPLQRTLNLVIFGGSVITGLRPPWGIRWLMLPLLPFALIFWLAVLISGLRKLASEKDSDLRLIGWMIPILAAGFIFSPYGDDPSGRYFLPLILPMAVFAADLLHRHLQGKPWFQAGLLLFVLAFNLGGVLQSRWLNPPGLTTQFDPVAQVDQSYIQELLEFFQAEGIQAGYSNYWVAYPVAFLTQEEIVFSPRLPYHEDFRYTERDDRYQPYTDRVRSSRDIAYVTTNHPDLNAYLRTSFLELEISWKEIRIGDYTVFYHLSAPVHPEQIGLGATTQP